MAFNLTVLTNSRPGQAKDGTDYVRIRANHGTRMGKAALQIKTRLLRLVKQVRSRTFLCHAEMVIGILCGNATSRRAHYEALLD